MISQLKLQEQDVWEAWVEFDQFCPNHFGTLYISGEVAAHGELRSWSRTIETDYGTQLVIELPSRPEGRCRLKEFFYAEPIQSPGFYHSVCIYAGNELVTRFQEIEVLI